MGNWYVDPGLGILIHQVKAQHPGMSVGTIGDKAHQDEDSDHNPEDDGSVDAADFMVGKYFLKADADRLVDALVKHRDNRIAYIIWWGHIISSTVAPWTWREYNGKDKHTGHPHVSVNDNHLSNRGNWDLSTGEKMPTYQTLTVKVPMIGQGDDDAKLGGYNMIARIQRLRGTDPDGVWGPATTKAVGASRMSEQLYRDILGLDR